MEAKGEAAMVSMCVWLRRGKRGGKEGALGFVGGLCVCLVGERASKKLPLFLCCRSFILQGGTGGVRERGTGSERGRDTVNTGVSIMIFEGGGMLVKRGEKIIAPLHRKRV